MQNYQQHLHAFRGFAILNIVGAHAWSFSIFWTGALDSVGLKTVFYSTELLFHGSTIYFAIISGLLFTRVLTHKPFTRFFANKLLNVILPYIAMSALATAIYWQYHLDAALEQGESISYLKTLFFSLISGSASIQFWYIPVLLFLFVITPFLALLNIKTPWIMFLLAASPLIFSRSTFPDFIEPRTFVYFSGAYALGMLIGTHYETLLQQTARFRNVLIVIVLITSITILYQYIEEYQTTSWFSSRQTLFYIQKVALCLLVLSLFHSRESSLPAWMKMLGTYAFAIYFLHVIFIGFLIIPLQGLINEHRTWAWITALGFGNMFVGIGGSIISAWLLQRLFKGYSKQIVGA